MSRCCSSLVKMAPVAKAATVDDYLAGLPEELRVVAAEAWAAIDAGLPQASCAIRWAHPTWSIGKSPVCYLKAASRHLTFGFWKGTSIVDASGRLETGGQVMAHVRLRHVGDIDRELFAGWLAQAAELA